MIQTKEIKKLSMGQKLKMFREINNMSQEELGTKLNVSDKTISAWENEERDINLANAELICNLFKIPEAYFVFNKCINEIDNNTVNLIIEYQKNYDFKNKISSIIQHCKAKILDDGLPFKKEYLPVFDFEAQKFTSFGLFNEKDLPIIVEYHNRGTGSILDTYHEIKIYEDKIDNPNSYQYNTSALSKYNLYDIIERFNSDTVQLIDLTNCNKIEVFQDTINRMKNRDYVKSNLYGESFNINPNDVIQEQLNKVLEELNPDLTNYWHIILFLINNGAYYTKQYGYGDDITCFNDIKDISKTNLVYRIAKDKVER